MRRQMPPPLLRRLFAKLVHDVMPTALASIIGGFLITHFQFGRIPAPPAAAPASAAMMQLLRDEHALMVDFVQAEVAKEKVQPAAAEAPSSAPTAAMAVSDADSPAAAYAPRVMTAVSAAKPSPRGKAPAVGASLPLVIAEAQPNDAVEPVARNDDSLLAKTIGLKDHVFAVTQGVVTAISGIPSWIGSLGDRIGGRDASPRPAADLVSAS